MGWIISVSASIPSAEAPGTLATPMDGRPCACGAIRLRLRRRAVAKVRTPRVCYLAVTDGFPEVDLTQTRNICAELQGGAGWE
jgi:hypothetical protein